MRIAVLGAGAIGGLIAAKLVESGKEVLVHAKGEHGALLAISGLGITGEWNFRIDGSSWLVTLEDAGLHPELEGCCDFAIITCKAKDTSRLAEVARFICTGPVLSLQNGLGNVEILQEILGPHRVAGGVTTNAVFRPKAGEINWVAKGDLLVGGRCSGDFVKILSCLNAEEVTDLDAILWQKLLLNVAINPIAAICGVNNGALLSEEMFNQSEATMLEATSVARMEGVSLPSDEELVDRLRSVLESTSENFCSMLQDVKDGRETEIEMMCGEVVRRGERSGVPTPLNAMLTSQIKALR
jgi:2-dehydropantoate 2-reductase